MPDQIEYTESVAACLVDDSAPTPPLEDFIIDRAKDSNLVWRLGTGHVNELLEYAIEKWSEEKRDHDETHQVLIMLDDILHRTAIALKGPEPELTSWSWHDLPEIAARLKAESEMGLLERAIRVTKTFYWSSRQYVGQRISRS